MVNSMSESQESRGYAPQDDELMIPLCRIPV